MYLNAIPRQNKVKDSCSTMIKEQESRIILQNKDYYHLKFERIQLRRALDPFREGHLIIFEWDDILFPTSNIMENFGTCSDHTFVESLKNIRKSCY